jgi:hypothetical protein
MMFKDIAPPELNIAMINSSINFPLLRSSVFL